MISLGALRKHSKQFCYYLLVLEWSCCVMWMVLERWWIARKAALLVLGLQFLGGRKYAIWHMICARILAFLIAEKKRSKEVLILYFKMTMPFIKLFFYPRGYKKKAICILQVQIVMKIKQLNEVVIQQRGRKDETFSICILCWGELVSNVLWETEDELKNGNIP